MAFMKHIKVGVVPTLCGHSIRFYGSNGRPSYVPDDPELIGELQTKGAILVDDPRTVSFSASSVAISSTPDPLPTEEIPLPFDASAQLDEVAATKPSRKRTTTGG